MPVAEKYSSLITLSLNSTAHVGKPSSRQTMALPCQIEHARISEERGEFQISRVIHVASPLCTVVTYLPIVGVAYSKRLCRTEAASALSLKGTPDLGDERVRH